MDGFEFKLAVRDEIEEIGNGTHDRMIIELERLTCRLAAKSKPIASGGWHAALLKWFPCSRLEQIDPRELRRWELSSCLKQSSDE